MLTSNLGNAVNTEPSDVDEVTRMLDIAPVNMSLRKLTSHRRAFPNDDALSKLIYLALWNISER